jgi:hypothetical protein
MSIKLTELRAVSDKLFAHLENRGYTSIDLPVDYYWDIAKQQRFDSYQEPNQFNLGQLSDDWTELQKIQSGDASTVAYALVWLASVLRAIGEEVVE